MIGSKSSSSIRPVALGSTVQASDYGRVIPVTMGRTKTPLIVTWLANLRKADSDKTAKKILTLGLKKNQQGYVENIEFLTGHNPIMGILQCWANQNQRFPLKFAQAVGSSVSDVNFYMIIGVTLGGSYPDTTFDDYGAPGPLIIPGATYEIPVWNAAFNGPDPTCPRAFRYPYSYHWVPADGNTIPAGGNYNIYYAQLDPDGSKAYSKKNSGTDVPIGALRLTFEPIMGDGPQFTGNDKKSGLPLANQRIYYPAYAGLGSEHIDLGSGTAAPDIRPEVLGMYPLYPSGDCDFADMVEAIFKQGPGQVGFATTSDTTQIQGMNIHKVQWGLNCYNFPGTIQRKSVGSVEPFPIPAMYDMPNVEGNILIAMAATYIIGGGTSASLGISDTAGNTWIPILPDGHIYQVWYAIAKPAINNTVNFTGMSYNWNAIVAEIGGVDTLDAVAYSLSNTVSITSTVEDGLPGYLMAFGFFDDFTAGGPPPDLQQWDSLQDGSNYHYTAYDRRIYSPGTFTIKTPSVFPFDPSASVLIALKQSKVPDYPRALGNRLDDLGLDQCRLQSRANGMWGSLCMDSQQAAKDWLDDLYTAMNAAPFWSEGKLKSVPRSEVSAIGNGATYRPPTASGPIKLTLSDFVGDPSQPHYTIERKAQIDIPNILQFQHPNRNGDYNDVTISEPETASISMYGPRKDSPKVMRMVQDPAVARKILNVAVKRRNYIERNNIKFTLNAKWDLLEPMTLVQLPADLTTGLTAMDVRLTSVGDEVDGRVPCEAEPFIYGANAPQDLTTMGTASYAIQLGDTAGNVNVPIIFEPVPRMLTHNDPAMAIWLVISSPALNYGGAVVYVSSDGGNGYSLLDTVTGNSVTGVTTAIWPSIMSSTDTANDLLVDLTESNGILSSSTVAEEDAYLNPCYVGSAVAPNSAMVPYTDVDYEVMTYAAASLTSLNNYTMSATGTGNHLNRGVFGAQFLGAGSSHAAGARFAYLGPPGERPGILKVPIDPKWIGQTIYFKICSFNDTGGGLQSQQDVVAYPYTVKGVSWARVVFGDYTVQPGDGPLQVNAVGGPITITLPSGSTNTNTNITKVDTSGNVVTLAGGGTGIVDTALTGQYQNVGIQDTNSGWVQTTTPLGREIFNETPAGAQDGTNMVFTLSHAPNPPDSLRLYYRGIRLTAGVDFTLSGNTITMLNYKVTAVDGDVLRAQYKY